MTKAKLKPLYMSGEVTMVELVDSLVTGAELDYVGSITLDPFTLEKADILLGQMVYIDDKARRTPPWRTYTVPGVPGHGEVIMNGPPAHHFKKNDPVTIRAGARISFADMPRMAKGHTLVHFTQDEGDRNRALKPTRVALPSNHERQMCVSKLHRLLVTGTTVNGPEALIVDEDILDAAGFPAGLEVQFTSLLDGAIRRTCVHTGKRGTGEAIVQGAGARHISAGVRLVSLAEVWLPYEDAKKVKGPQVAFFREEVTTHNVIKEIKPGWRPS